MRSRFFMLPLVGLLLSGCVGDGTSTDPVRGIAASLVAGESFDQAYGALQRDDSRALEKAGQGLRDASGALGDETLTNAFASAVTQEANQSFGLAQLAQGSQKDELMLSADRKYRAALAFVPEEAPEKLLDANTLNSLGYYLADRGEGRADFERAAILTLAAYRKWPMPGAILGFDPKVDRAVGPQDSYAWAIFRLGKFDEARKQEEEVLKIVRASSMAGTMTSELPFHMAEIYSAIGDLKSARKEYEAALLLQSDAEMKGKIEMGLKALDFKRV